MRSRSSAISITANVKKRMSLEGGIDNVRDLGEKKERLAIHIEDSISCDTVRHSKEEHHMLNISPPKFTEHKKEYYTKNDKSLKFHSKAKVMIERKYFEDGEDYTQQIDFVSFLSQFSNMVEISGVDLQDLINVDFDKLGELKEKISDFIQKSSNIIQNGDKDENKQKLLVFFCEKLNQIKKNEINVKALISNIEKVDKLICCENKTMVNFNK